MPLVRVDGRGQPECVDQRARIVPPAVAGIEPVKVHQFRPGP